MAPDTPVPDGVVHRVLTTFEDGRGTITELDRASWHPEHTALQWTFLSSVAGTVRGAHVHATHTDQLVVTTGRMLVALADLRRTSPTAGRRLMVELAPLEVLTIPPVVLHAFGFSTDTTFLNATTSEYDPSDDFEARYDDPELGFAWPIADPQLSVRDRSASDVATLLERCRTVGLDVVSTLA
ncbi:MAG TPA: dTDP-4-dehydrorhamnose 3,5-epimerase family protein [Acidimicrobiia bacterium]|jgi:dTDP-4-dehydrorhamnose 3,5-epimerase